jgi:integrase
VEVKGKKQIKKIGTLAVARATRAQLVSLFSWYETKYSEDDFRNPVPKLMKNDPLKAPDGRERALENHEIRALWEACNEMGDAYAACVQTALLTAQRFHKVSRMRRSDLKDGVWDATRPDDPKNKRVSIVALAPLALDVINDVPEIVVEDGADYVFTVTGRAPLRGWSKYKARLDRAMLGVLRRDDPQATLTPWQHRDLRRTARTIMAGEGVSDAVAEHCLGHVQSKIQRTYNRHDYASEKRLAFAKVAEYIERAINPPTDNVLPFEKRDGR